MKAGLLDCSVHWKKQIRFGAAAVGDIFSLKHLLLAKVLW
jgi:hypothetical protein